MTLDEIRTYATTQFGVESERSFKEDPTITVLMRTDNKKWFAATKNIGWRFLGFERSGRVDILNVKLDPREVAKLRVREGFMPAWKMNQNNWVTIILDGTVPDDEVYGLLGKAYELAGKPGRR